MHVYASDSSFRSPTAYFVLAAAGAALAWLVSVTVRALVASPPWWLEIPSSLTCFGLAVFLYNRFGWRWWSDLPDLNGTWLGEVSSSHDNHQQPVACALRIRQSWLRIALQMETAQSVSHSTMAALMLDHGLDTGLRYEYLSEPNPKSPATMQTHRGTAHFRPEPSGGRGLLHYYTGRGRGTTGEIQLRRVSADQISLSDAVRQGANSE